MTFHGQRTLGSHWYDEQWQTRLASQKPYFGGLYRRLQCDSSRVLGELRRRAERHRSREEAQELATQEEAQMDRQLQSGVERSSARRVCNTRSLGFARDDKRRKGSQFLQP